MDKDLIKDYCLGFYGYGDLRTNYWFVGMEEGGTNSITDFYNNDVLVWANDRKEIIDLEKGISAVAKINYFSPGAKIGRTWGRLIRIVLSIENKSIDNEAIRKFQIEKLGKLGGNNSLIELLPLPHKSFSDWMFRDLEIDCLKTRETYLEFYLSKRIKRIKEMITEHKPKAIIFYSTTQLYISASKEIIGSDCKFTDGSYIEKINDIIYCICKHPNAHGISNNYFNQIGGKIRSLL
jgi:hypothetical protein